MRTTVGQLRQLIVEALGKETLDAQRLTSDKRNRRYVKPTMEEFASKWQGQDVFVRFEQPHAGLPVSLNRQHTYGDVWGVWGFSLLHPWPNWKHFTNMKNVYVFRLKSGSRTLDTKAYSETDWIRDEKLLRSQFGDDVDNALKLHQEYPNNYSDPAKMQPGERIYSVVDRISTGRSGSVENNRILRRLGYDAIVDTLHVFDSGAYRPAVAGAALMTSVIEIVDSF